MHALMNTLSVLLCTFILCSCASTEERNPLPNDPFYAPVVPDVPRQKLADDGSIFQADMANSIYSDVKGRRVGDIITVTLRENTNASKSAGTSTSKDTSIALNPIVGLGGNTVNIGSESIQLGIDNTNSFAGDASTNQSNALSGNITVTVIQVLSNQNLVVRGEKWLTLNNGDEYIRLTGVVRPADISPSNEVLSSKVANARIQYSGTGSFAETQKQGWLTNFFTGEWWPF